MNLLDEVDKVARGVAAEWSEVIDPEDLVQEIWLIITDRRYTETLAGLEPAARFSTLRKIGHQIAMQYRADHDWFSNQYHYSTTEVRKLLQDGRLSKERSRTETEWLDLDEGWALLMDRNVNYSEILVQAFTLNTFDNTTGTARKDLSRAVDALTRCMNSAHKRRHAAHDGPGSRKAVRNGHAQAMTSPEWQG